MDRITVSDATETFEELLNALNSAYWDVSQIFQKDTLFDIICNIQAELNEISKLSVNDMSMGYEPITARLPNTYNKIKKLQHELEDWFPRTETSENLQHSLNTMMSIVNMNIR